MQFEEYKNKIKKKYKLDDKLIDNDELFHILEAMDNDRKQNDWYNKNELINQRIEDEINNKTAAEEMLDLMLENTLIDLMSGAFVSSNHTLEKDSLEFNNRIAYGLKNFKNADFPYDIVLDCETDLQKFIEFVGFIKKYYEEKFKSENNWHNWSSIHTNAKVYKLLLSGIYLEKNFKIPLSDAMKWFDYSVLILHYLKALEKFLVHKLNNEKILNAKEYKKIYMSKIIEKVKKYKEQLFKEDVPLFVENNYFKMLDDFGAIYRNGYVHREYLSYEKALFIQDMVLKIIVLTELIFK